MTRILFWITFMLNFDESKGLDDDLVNKWEKISNCLQPLQQFLDIYLMLISL